MHSVLGQDVPHPRASTNVVQSRDAPPDALELELELELEVVIPRASHDPSRMALGDVVSAMAQALGERLGRPPGRLGLPVEGWASLGLSQGLLRCYFGPGLVLTRQGTETTIRWPAPRTRAERDAQVEGLRDLADQVLREALRREHRLGFHALASYRPNDPKRPTVCLVHGWKASQETFHHLATALEGMGYGVVVYDYPPYQDLATASQEFRVAWRTFRIRTQDQLPWAVVTHGAGALLARSYIEADGPYQQDVRHLIMIAPIHQGSRGMAILALRHSCEALGWLIAAGKPRDALEARSALLLTLCDGLGAHVRDLGVDSPWLQAINQRPRRAGVHYQNVVGDASRPATKSGSPTAPWLQRWKDRQVRIAHHAIGHALTRGGGQGQGPSPDGLGDVGEMSLKPWHHYRTGWGDGWLDHAQSQLDGVAPPTVVPGHHWALIRAETYAPNQGPIPVLPVLRNTLGEPENPTNPAGH